MALFQATFLYFFGVKEESSRAKPIEHEVKALPFPFLFSRWQIPFYFLSSLEIAAGLVSVNKKFCSEHYWGINDRLNGSLHTVPKSIFFVYQVVWK